jgi:hypothetical protein
MARVVPHPKQPPKQFVTKAGTKFRGYRTLTKPEFQAWKKDQPKKPGGRSYENYRTFLEKYRAGKKPQGAGGGGGGRGGGRSSSSSLETLLQIQTPRQIEAQANRMAAAQLKAQRDFLMAQSAQEKADALRQMQAVAAAGRQAAAMNAGLFGMVGGEYNAAANELRGLSSGLAGAVGATTEADVAARNEALATVGAPTVTVGGGIYAPSVAGATQTGVENLYSGGIPADAMGTAGEAATFGLAGLVGSQNLRATQEGTAAYVGAMRDLNSNQRLALMELASKRPELVAGFMDTLKAENWKRVEIKREMNEKLAEARQAKQALNFKYAELRQEAVTAAQKAALDKWYKQQSLAIDQYRADIYKQNADTSAYSAESGRISANASASRAATAAAKAAAEGKGDGKGRTWMATTANQIALLPTRLKGTDAAFNWVWSRIVNKIPKNKRPEARRWLKKQLGQVAESGSSGASGGTLVLPD